VCVICSSLIGNTALSFGEMQSIDAGQNAGLRIVDDACLMRDLRDAVIFLA
jgi:hypothetical protein